MTQGEKWWATMIEKMGTREAVLEHLRGNGSKGGKIGTTGGFYANRELAKKAGRIGGRKSKRPKKVVANNHKV